MNTEPQVVTKTPKVKKEKIQSPGRVKKKYNLLGE